MTAKDTQVSESSIAVWGLKIGEKYVYRSRNALLGAAYRCRKTHPERQFIVRLISGTYKYYIKREQDRVNYHVPL